MVLGSKMHHVKRFGKVDGNRPWLLQTNAIQYSAIRDRLRAVDPQLDDETLADTVEGLTDLHEILAAVVRAALTDEALAAGLRQRIAVMQGRLDGFLYRAASRREITRHVMIQSEIKKVGAPDLTILMRPGTPSVVITDEAAIPPEFWKPSAPRLDRQSLLSELKSGTKVHGAELSNPEPVMSVRTK